MPVFFSKLSHRLKKSRLRPDEDALSKKPTWTGFTLQLFLFTILPLSVLLLIVAFGSQSLHHEAMRNLVGDRDLRTVQAATSGLERWIGDFSRELKLIARLLPVNGDFYAMAIDPDEIKATFDGGLALFSPQGRLIHSTRSSIDWEKAVPQLLPFFEESYTAGQAVVYSIHIMPSGSGPLVLAGVVTPSGNLLAAAFDAEKQIGAALGDLSSAGQTSVIVVARNQTGLNHTILYRSGPKKSDQDDPDHAGFREVLDGEKGVNYYHGQAGEHVVAFSPIRPAGWGLVLEEAWEDIASPYLITTQAAPLILVPLFLLALVTIWFGARRIVLPLQQLEKQTASLAGGDFEPIHQTVGGIVEIRNLQAELIDMADRLKTAQESLHSYVGDITTRVENERRSLSRELHDDTIQSLIAINQRLQMILKNCPDKQKGGIVEIQQLAQQAMENLRRMIRGLRPIYLEDIGLAPSLEILAREFEGTSHIPIAFQLTGIERRLEAQCEMALYRMVQESFNNVVKHACARRVTLDIHFSDIEVSIRISDDGQGFKVPENRTDFARRGHYGLLGIYERAELINARVRIESSTGKGTTVTISVPDPVL